MLARGHSNVRTSPIMGQLGACKKFWFTFVDQCPLSSTLQWPEQHQVQSKSQFMIWSFVHLPASNCFWLASNSYCLCLAAFFLSYLACASFFLFLVFIVYLYISTLLFLLVQREMDPCSFSFYCFLHLNIHHQKNHLQNHLPFLCQQLWMSFQICYVMVYIVNLNHCEINKHVEILVSCSDKERNCIQAHETACKLMELHVSSWNFM